MLLRRVWKGVSWVATCRYSVTWPYCRHQLAVQNVWAPRRVVQSSGAWGFSPEYRRLRIKSEASFSCNYVKSRIVKHGILAATDLGRWISLGLVEVSSHQLYGSVTRGQKRSGECRVMTDWVWPVSFSWRTFYVACVHSVAVWTAAVVRNCVHSVAVWTLAVVRNCVHSVAVWTAAVVRNCVPCLGGVRDFMLIKLKVKMCMKD